MHDITILMTWMGLFWFLALAVHRVLAVILFPLALIGAFYLAEYEPADEPTTAEWLWNE